MYCGSRDFGDDDSVSHEPDQRTSAQLTALVTGAERVVSVLVAAASNRTTSSSRRAWVLLPDTTLILGDKVVSMLVAFSTGCDAAVGRDCSDT
ncbi:hypothetical protein DIJ64_09595 [Mycobacterium leprae]|uniref:Uncharacterized protein n=1 Tax=Mycobacterium leprae TaxID=1769 RepID=A0AAD0P551_MYCLR|nr:hypothetical protein DIJ64_09595 [Mycobacterium leprae]OAX70956.1 hypothetical protein A3216_08675 [Mycobacterium leprae 7935681]